MEKIKQISGKVIPLNMNDVDTDLIIPAQYLTAITRQGYGENLFRRLREADANFIFNQAKFSGASILVTKHNFGCGSSREHAVWALQEAGIKVIIAISFGDIFFSNAVKNGLILIKLSENIIHSMLDLAKDGSYSLDINIEEQSIASSKNEFFNFEMDSFRKYCFVNGLDDLDYLLSYQDEINSYKATQRIL
jgi:3-isopropylmalate/(R)-2-methylmalate dehydratase small subunit